MSASEVTPPKGAPGDGLAGNEKEDLGPAEMPGPRITPRRYGSLRAKEPRRRFTDLKRHAVGAPCQIETDRRGDAVQITLTGQLDLSCNDRFLDHLREARDAAPKHLVIDLRELTFIDSTGLALLLRANGVAHQFGFDLHVVRSPVAIVQVVFEATGVDKLLPLVDEPPALSE